MKLKYPHINSVWASLIVEELVRCGVNQFFISPGSRNTPLTAAVAQHDRTSSIVHFDERGASFAATGYSKATGEPSALICTSGTAAANYFPAVVEASQDMVPLVLLTADRPPELRDTGSNQTINQVRLYGDYVRWFCDLPCPSKEIEPTFPLTTIDNAVYRSIRSPSGPVHINCMFRKPLAPVGENENFSDYLSMLSEWLGSNQPYTGYRIPEHKSTGLDFEDIVRWINNTKRGVVVVGSLRNDADQQAALRLSRRLGWPLFPDITSGLRTGAVNDSSFDITAHYFDIMLADENFANIHQPESVIHLGGRVTSKRLTTWLKKSHPRYYLTVANHPYRQDPDHLLTDRLDSSVASFVKVIEPLLHSSGNATEWMETLLQSSSMVGNAISSQFDDNDKLNEPSVARLISQQINPEACLFLGNSMPIRDMDTFADVYGPTVPVGCNRGASGIDGGVASAFGFALGLNRMATLLLGDLALLHDLNSLSLLQRFDKPMTIVVINNNGGGIFSFLPIAQRNDMFENFWGTPHNMNFESIAQQFGLKYECPSTQNDFRQIYKALQTEESSTLIEIQTNREDNAKLHNEFLRSITAEFDKG